GQATDIAIHANEIISVKKNLSTILADHCHMSNDIIEKNLERDTFLRPDEAVNLGIVDKILYKQIKK
ncbi:MAG: hypothetical protein MHPSP_003484, partial [Paramarteilia canceri]